MNERIPSRDEIADELTGWPIGAGYYATTVAIDEARGMADAVLALMKGQEPPHERSLLMREANTLCWRDEPHEGQRVVTWDENDNIVEETPPCEDHIRMAEAIQGSLAIAYGIGLQRGYEVATGTDMPFMQLINEKSPYRHSAYRDDFDNFTWEETE